MNPVEISEAVSDLALEPFDRAEFPFQFLAAFDNNETTIRRLRTGNSNASDVPGGVLQVKKIHIATCAPGEVDATLTALRVSPKTVKSKAQFILATDGDTFQAEDLSDGGTVSCAYKDFPEHFGFFLPLAGITTVPQIRENAFDVKATGRLTKLYLQLLRENPDWDKAERQHDMNHFMARLIFCFFAEDTDIFPGKALFTGTIETMTARDSSDTHAVIGELFRAMDTAHAKREGAGLPPYASKFPYVNGQLFSGSTDVPTFSKVARTYLLHVGNLPWQKINPDIFGSMIQAVTDEAERGSLGMHYTSVPNILKVLNPLFLDDLRAKLEEAGDNARKLLNLRNRMARIRVFDPACGSGNFLVIAYKQMRALEAEINAKRGERDRKSDIPLTNFRGIELREFPAEIARLALIIAEYQSDVLHRGQREALVDFLPLSSENWIVRDNALRLDWLSVCPPTGTGVKLAADDLFGTPLDQAEIDFENEGGETYLCGNPPYLGSVVQDQAQKADLENAFRSRTKGWKSLDYVAGWFIKAAEYGNNSRASFAFVATNSICQGEQVPILWPLLFGMGYRIDFAFQSFKWANLASKKAGVTVVIVGLTKNSSNAPVILSENSVGEITARVVDNIGPYLVASENICVSPRSNSPDQRATMIRGNMPNDGGHLILSSAEAEDILSSCSNAGDFIKQYIGSNELINGKVRHCIWIADHELADAMECDPLKERVERVREVRLKGGQQARDYAETPHKFVFAPHRAGTAIVVPRVSSENRAYLPFAVTDGGYVISERNFALYGAELWNAALIASRLHWVWIGAVCVRLEMRFSYSNTLGWNTFPLPKMTVQSMADLARCAENILLAREAHFPATIADLYDSDDMPDDLRRAHDANDEVLERIYIGRRFRNDTERLEKLFELYTTMTGKKAAA